MFLEQYALYMLVFSAGTCHMQMGLSYLNCMKSELEKYRQGVFITLFYFFDRFE
jgi:hypothetical protein